MSTETRPGADFTHLGPDPFQALLDRHYPSEHTENDRPPAMANPELGQAIPLDDACPRCHYLRRYWVYNPFSANNVDGWTLHRARLCHCPESDPYQELAALRPPTRSGPDPHWLEREFSQASLRPLTLLSFPIAHHAKMAAMHAACQDYAHRFASTPRPTRGLCLCGPPGIGKGHLATALVNAARAQGETALSLSQSRLLSLSLPEASETADDHDDRKRRQKALRAVPVLAIRDLSPTLLLPSETKELLLLLEIRAERQLVTHFTLLAAPAQIRRRAEHLPDGVLLLLAHVERLTERPLIAPNGTQPAPHSGSTIDG